MQSEKVHHQKITWLRERGLMLVPCQPLRFLDQTKSVGTLLSRIRRTMDRNDTVAMGSDADFDWA
jgi:hypothetical protein